MLFFNGVLEILEHASGMMALFAVAAMIIGFVLAAKRYSGQFNAQGKEENFTQFKIGLGRALILGLEILVVADVIETITEEKTSKSLGTLAILVVVRTVVSWTLVLQSEGRWPWQAQVGEPKNA